MEQQKQRSLSSLAKHVSHRPADLNLPSVPQTELSSFHVQAELTLPDLKTILSPDFQQESLHRERDSPVSARSLPRIEARHADASVYPAPRRSVESAMMSPSEAGSAMSVHEEHQPQQQRQQDQRGLRSTSVVSMDDPDVRMAAEALSGLGNPDFARSKISLSHDNPDGAHVSQEQEEEPEPLLQLFTRAHPWVVSTINGSLNAYSTTKHYSPRLVQNGANLIERNITNPVVSTVSTVGRMTGVESGLRWYYGGSPARAGDMEHSHAEEPSQSKKLRLANGDEDMEDSTLQLHLSRDSEDSARADYLPAYRASKPPSYREEASPSSTDRTTRSEVNRSLSSQVFVMTSGLGIALSYTSRRTLGFCLHMLGNAVEHLQTVMHALQLVLEEYDQARHAWREQRSSAKSSEKAEAKMGAEEDEDEAARRLARLIQSHSDDIWRTLQAVVTTISNSAGGALPENAREFVRTQLLSLPQRWHVVSTSTSSSPRTSHQNETSSPTAATVEVSETSRRAHRMIAFAYEGLDMMRQVSQTMKLTLESAERWLERVGRRRAEGRRETVQVGVAGKADVDMEMDVEAQRGEPWQK